MLTCPASWWGLRLVEASGKVRKPRFTVCFWAGPRKCTVKSSRNGESQRVANCELAHNLTGEWDSAKVKSYPFPPT